MYRTKYFMYVSIAITVYLDTFFNVTQGYCFFLWQDRIARVHMHVCMYILEKNILYEKRCILKATSKILLNFFQTHTNKHDSQSFPSILNCYTCRHMAVQ